MPSASSPPGSDPHSTPGSWICWFLRKHPRDVPVLRPDVHSWALPLHTLTHTHTAVSAGTSGPGGRGPAGELQSLGSGASQAPGKGSLCSSPSAPGRPGGGTCGKAPCGQRPSQLPRDPPPPDPLRRQDLRSSWVSGESGNKAKESHFLLRGRKEAEIQPAAHPAGEAAARGRAARGCGAYSYPLPQLCNPLEALFCVWFRIELSWRWGRYCTPHPLQGS